MIPGLIAHIWQSTLFAGAAWLVNLAFRKNAARVRYAIWFIASAKFLIPFSVLVGLGTLVPRRAVAPPVQTVWVTVAEQIGQPLIAVPGVAAQVAVTGNGANRSYFAAIALALWGCGFGVIATCWLVRWKRVRALRMVATLVNIANRSEFAVPVMSAPDLVEPGIVGILRPVLLLPDGISEKLDHEQLDAILTHELCHVRRRDNLTATIHMAVQAIFWFHPLVWWLGARLLDERERACDEEVLRLGYKPQVYAAAILNVCKLYVELPLACVAGVMGANLKRRIEAIMRNRIALRLSFAGKLALAATGIAVLAVPVTLGILDSSTMRAQSPAARATAQFEAASVRPSAPIPPSGGVYIGPPRGGPGTSDPGLITWSYASLKALLMAAYGMTKYQVSGPAWLDTERYDIVARVPSGATKEQVMVMWQKLLAERLGVVLHHEAKEFQVEELVIDKGGSKLKETDWDPASPLPPGPPQRDNRSGDLGSPGQVLVVTPRDTGANVHQIDKAQPISQLTTTIGNTLGRPILDKTGLTGKYDYTIDYAVEPGLAYVPPPPGERLGPVTVAGNAGDFGLDIAAAVQQQLGLRLVPNKAMIDVVIIDKAEKTPTAN